MLANTIVCFFQLVMAFQLNTFTGKVSQAEGMKVDRSTRFSYEELSGAINNFSMDHKIGHGDFGSVYSAELRGKVCLIGYCVESHSGYGGCHPCFCLGQRHCRRGHSDCASRCSTVTSLKLFCCYDLNYMFEALFFICL